MPPVKPDVCAIDGKIAIFIGGGYQHLTVEQANNLITNITAALVRTNHEASRLPKRATGDVLDVEGGYVPGKYRLADKLFAELELQRSQS